jgi:hypothetical protein
MSRTGPRPFWTTERLAQLRALWKQGLDNDQLATQLGDVTRGAVATALRRHGMRSHLPKRTPRFWTPQRLAQLRALWAQGLSNDELAVKIGTTSNGVTNALRRHGMEHRPEVWPPERNERFKQLWADASLTTTQIAELIGLEHCSAVSHRAAELGLPSRNAPHKHWTAAENAQLRLLWAKMPWPKKIAKRLGCNVASVRRQVGILRLPQRETTWTPWTPARDAEFRLLWVLEPQISPQQIALQLGCTKSAVINRRPKLGLLRRAPGAGNRVSLAAWNAMSEAERRRLPAFRSPVHRTLKIKRRRKRWGSTTF